MKNNKGKGRIISFCGIDTHRQDSIPEKTKDLQRKDTYNIQHKHEG